MLTVATRGHQSPQGSASASPPTAHPLGVPRGVTAGLVLEAGFCWSPGCLESVEVAQEETTGGGRRQAGAGDG